MLIFLPATVSASGFLQASFHFCSGFARIGVYNFGSLGQTHKVTDESSRTIDKRKGNQITLYAAVIGAIMAFLGIVMLH